MPAVDDLLPHTGNARISYILGYRSKKRKSSVQVNIIWTGDGTAAGDETIVGIANSLRDYFASENFKQDSVVADHQLPRTRSWCFSAMTIGKDGLLVLSGVAASARSDGKREPRPSPLTLEL